jgi:hypothetical protein
VQNNMRELFGLMNCLDQERWPDVDAFLEEFGDDSPSVEQIKRLQVRPAPGRLGGLGVCRGGAGLAAAGLGWAARLSAAAAATWSAPPGPGWAGLGSCACACTKGASLRSRRPER